MMKSFFKKLAFVMALAMVVSMVAPAGSALAAEAGVSLQGTKTIVTTYELDKAGATVDFSYQGAPKDWKTTSKWTSSDEAVATVDKNGVVTAVAAGTATITITSGADASYVQTVVVTVKEEAKAFEIAQVNTNTVTLTFDKAPTEAELAAGLTFNMVVSGVPVTLPVNTVKVKDNVATVVVFSTFVDGEEYSFVYGDDTVAFVASVGEIDHVAFTYFTGEDPTKNVGKAYVNEEDGEDFETTFVPKLYDANNVDITAKYDLDDDVEITYELMTEDDSIELDENEGVITFDKVAAAAVTMTVTWEDNDAEEYSKSFTGVVIAEKLPEIAVEYVKSGFVKAESYIAGAMEDFTTSRWSQFWDGTISLKNSYTLPDDGATYQFAALFNDNRGGQVVTGTDDYYGTFSFKSSNDDVLDIDEDGELTFYEAGTAHVLIYFTPDNDDDDAKAVFVGSQKLTVYPANYAKSFKVVNTTVETSTDALRLYSWQDGNNDYNYNRVCFEVAVLDQNGNTMWTDAFADLFEVEAQKEENTVRLEAPVFDSNSGVYKFYVDGDSFTLGEDDDYKKFKYDLSIDKTVDISKNITTKPVTLTVKVEDNVKDAAGLAAYLDEFASLDGITAPAGAVATDDFNIVGWKGGYGIDLVIKQTQNWKATGSSTKKDVKLGWANGLTYVDDNGYTLAPVPVELILEKDKDTTTGEAGKVYYTISAPSGTIEYNANKTVKETDKWTFKVVDGGICFQWNGETMPTDYYNATGEYEDYAKTGTYSVTFFAVKKDGGKLYEKGTYSFNVTNSQTLPTYEGFNADYTNYTDLDIPAVPVAPEEPDEVEEPTAPAAGAENYDELYAKYEEELEAYNEYVEALAEYEADYAAYEEALDDCRDDLSAIVMKHLVFKYNGTELKDAEDWSDADVSINWAASDFSVIAGEKLRIKKLVIKTPIDTRDDHNHYFETKVNVGKNIYAEED